MRYICDFHIHSKYSRATSKLMEPENLARWAKIKGIDVIGTGDFTHPAYFAELKEKLTPAESGLYKFKGEKNNGTRFVLTAEISCIYSKNSKVRKIHILLLVPSLEAAEKINLKLSAIGNLRSDGRPILGLDAKELLKIALNVSPACFVVPAHAWTPWFSIFGSKSGFDSIEECFEDYAKYIFAIETGLSSDPAMNWRLSALDKIALISNSDAHSPENLGREANIFEGDKIDYYSLMSAIKNKGQSDISKTLPVKFVSTIEFFPEEGKYHFDGHRLCKVSFSPKETKEHKNICPVCGRTLTLGVDYRVDVLADRPEKFTPPGAVPFKNMIPLREIVAEALGIGKASKAVVGEYERMIAVFGSEFKILLDADEESLKKNALPIIAEGIIRMRQGKVIIKPGYDGEYGIIKIFEDEERKKFEKEKNLAQQSLLKI